MNNKIYVGVHSTNKLDDGYIGSGWVLKDAIKKYGREKFTREILYMFPSRREAMAMEAEIVDQDFVDRKDTYNLTIGGLGVIDQTGDKNPMFGKVAHNATPVKATHKDGRVIYGDSLTDLGQQIGMARGNVRALVVSGKRGKRGWLVERVKI